MMSKKGKTSPNEYRTGGPIHRNNCGALFAVGIFVFLTVAGMLLTAGFLSMRGHSLDTYKVIAALSVPEETHSGSNDLHMEGLVMDCKELGITCQAISEFCEKYYELPKGIYIIGVKRNAPAAYHGILPGDILMKVNGESLRSPEALQEIIASCPAGKPIALELNRKGKIFTIHFTPGV